MNIKLLLVSIGLFFGMYNHLYADSPLTSTNISQAYQDVPIVQEAAKADGKLTTSLMNYLVDKGNPIDVKIALINELGWDVDGKNNAEIFFEYLKNNKNYKDEEQFLKKANADLLISMAYLKAMDNYFEVEKALLYAEKARSKNPKSYTVNIIMALILAQKAQGYDWCEAYKYTNYVRENPNLNKDMRERAIYIIFEYMDLYKSEC